MQKDRPIGIFDSGSGGLAVARVIKDLLPYESIYYIGDTANLPYGEKSAAQLQAYTRAIGTLLVTQRCKLILIACNTATAAAAKQLQIQVGSQVPVLNIIDPVINYVKQLFAGKTIGLIASRYTVESRVYHKKFHAIQADLHLKTLATPQLASMVESGLCQQAVLENYLAHPQLAHIQALILGCTHYYYLKPQIANYYQHAIELIEGARLLAEVLQIVLSQRQLNNTSYPNWPDQFVATKLTANIQTMTERSFGKAVQPVSLP